MSSTRLAWRRPVIHFANAFWHLWNPFPIWFAGLRLSWPIATVCFVWGGLWATQAGGQASNIQCFMSNSEQRHLSVVSLKHLRKGINYFSVLSLLWQTTMRLQLFLFNMAYRRGGLVPVGEGSSLTSLVQKVRMQRKRKNDKDTVQNAFERLCGGDGDVLHCELRESPEMCHVA